MTNRFFAICHNQTKLSSTAMSRFHSLIHFRPWRISKTVCVVYLTSVVSWRRYRILLVGKRGKCLSAPNGRCVVTWSRPIRLELIYGIRKHQFPVCWRDARARRTCPLNSSRRSACYLYCFGCCYFAVSLLDTATEPAASTKTGYCGITAYDYFTAYYVCLLQHAHKMRCFQNAIETRKWINFFYSVR